MDVILALREKIATLPLGDYSAGLQAVQVHIEAAVHHFRRAQNDGDDSLFTDCVYRCNQAFEGSNKEAYRVLAKEDPDRKTIFHVEEFLISGRVLKPKVLALMTNYRKDWRNPSTHNYMLNFDEDEALLAIVSVSVFAIVLCDQIQGAVAFDNPDLSEDPSDPVTSESQNFLDRFSQKTLQFCTLYAEQNSKPERASTLQSKFEGALARFLQDSFSEFPDISVMMGGSVDDEIDADIVAETPAGKIAFEVNVTNVPARRNSFFQSAAVVATSHLISDKVLGVIAVVFSSKHTKFYVSAEGGALWQNRLRLITWDDAETPRSWAHDR